MLSTSRRLYELNILDSAHAEPLWSVRMSTGTQIGDSGHTPSVFQCVFECVCMCVCYAVFDTVITLSSEGYHICFPSCFIVRGEKEREPFFSAKAFPLWQRKVSLCLLFSHTLSYAFLVTPCVLSLRFSYLVWFLSTCCFQLVVCVKIVFALPLSPILPVFYISTLNQLFFLTLFFDLFAFLSFCCLSSPSLYISSLSLPHLVPLSIWLIWKPFKAIDVGMMASLCASLSLYVSVSANVSVSVMYIPCLYKNVHTCKGIRRVSSPAEEVKPSYQLLLCVDSV